MIRKILLTSLVILKALNLCAQNTPINQTAAGMTPGDAFSYNGYSVPNYGLGWYYDQGPNVTPTIPPFAYMSAFGGIKFFTWTQLRVVIDGNGNVGIGTTGPELKLHVDGATGFPASSGINQTGIMRLGVAGGYGSVLDFGSNGVMGQGWIQSTDRSNLALTYPLLLNPNGGNVGIGTTTPNAKLDISGFIRVNGNNANIDPAISTVGNLNSLAGTAQMLMGWNRTAGAGEADFIANQGGGNTGGFAFYNHDNNNQETQLMWILGNGQVLIGDTQGKQGNYKLAVAGDAIANSITVKMVPNWPDYVFKPTYQLKPLSEIKTYIDQNQHLPDMPSAAEVEKGGVNLGEMVKLQTKKIEELTLYLLEQQKQIDELKKKLEEK